MSNTDTATKFTATKFTATEALEILDHDYGWATSFVTNLGVLDADALYTDEDIENLTYKIEELAAA